MAKQLVDAGVVYKGTAAGVTPFISIHYVMPTSLYDERLHASLIQRSEEVTFQVPVEKCPKELTDHELLSMTWQLNWQSCLSYLLLSLSLVPTPEFKEKLGVVWIDIKKFVINVNGRATEKWVKYEKPIPLRKLHSYKVELITTSDNISLAPNCSIHGQLEIYLLSNTLEIIEEVKVPISTALHDFGQLLAFNASDSAKKFCDLTLAVKQAQGEEVGADPNQSVEFYAHKAVLAIRSPVFASMFSCNMKEAATNTIPMEDIEPEVLKELLVYIYTGHCPNIKTYAASLLYHAEKYELSRLKALCERRLSYDLQVDNAAKTLILANTYNAKQLKRNALLFIEEHGDEVELTEDWEDVTKSIDLLRDLVSTRYRKKRKLK